MHQYAFHLAVEHTMKEIGKLYDDAEATEIGGFKLRDIFKMDRPTMQGNHISYDGHHTKR